MARLVSWVFLLTTCISGVLLAFYLHCPIPETMANRNFVVFAEPVIRLLMYYPNQIMSFFGLYGARICWTRLFFNFANSLHISSENAEDFAKIEETLLDTVPVTFYLPKNRRNNGIIFFIHGGGYVIGSSKTHDVFLRLLTLKTQMTVCSIDYRLAPEHKFPTAILDVERAISYFVEKVYQDYQVDPKKLVISGDSAGGALSAIFTQRAKNHALLKNAIKAQVLLYPYTQFVDLKTPSYQMNQKYLDGTAFLDSDSLIFWFFSYLGINMQYRTSILNNEHMCSEEFRSNYSDKLAFINHDLLPFDKNDRFYTRPNYENCRDEKKSAEAYGSWVMDPDFAPLMAPDNFLVGLPRSLVVTCEFDPLRDDGYWYYLRLKNAGVNVKWSHYKQGFHGLANSIDHFELGRQMVADVADFIISSF